MTRVISAVILCAAVLTVSSTSAEDIYSWTDEEGVVHYSDIEPVSPGAPVATESEIPHDASEDLKRSEKDQKEIDAIYRERAEKERLKKQQKRAKRKKRVRPPTREETIVAEEKRLEKTIADLEAKPLSYFGSAKNKRLRLGYYHYRLEELKEDPDAYFGWKSK